MRRATWKRTAANRNLRYLAGATDMLFLLAPYFFTFWISNLSNSMTASMAFSPWVQNSPGRSFLPSSAWVPILVHFLPSLLTNLASALKML